MKARSKIIDAFIKHTYSKDLPVNICRVGWQLQGTPVMEFNTNKESSQSGSSSKHSDDFVILVTLFLCKFNLANVLYIDSSRLFNLTDLLRPFSRE